VLAETPVRFFLGGTIVSLFALIGTVLRPPSFAGIFGSAPSVAIASLALAFAKDGRVYAATESRSMLVGAIGLVAYSGSCVWAINRPGFPVWGAAAICWLTWFAVSLGVRPVRGRPNKPSVHRRAAGKTRLLSI
jgi:hypothetical protein